MHKIDISRIDLNLLILFEVLLAERNVGRAAERLQLSQSATSHALGRLRRLFGDPLFIRHAAGVEPTHRARQLADDLAGALAHVRRMMGSTRFDPATLERTFTVATHEYAVAVLMPRLLALLHRDAPGVDIRCVGPSYRDLIAALDRGEADLACGAFPGLDTKRIERTPLFTDRFVGMVRVGHPALSAGGLDLEAFVSSLHVWVATGERPYDPVAVALAERGRARRVGLTVPYALSVPVVLASSDLVGVVPERLGASLSVSLPVVMFELPIVLGTMTCDLLVPTSLAATPEARWLTDIFVSAATDEVA